MRATVERELRVIRDTLDRDLRTFQNLVEVASSQLPPKRASILPCAQLGFEVLQIPMYSWKRPGENLLGLTLRRGCRPRPGSVLARWNDDVPHLGPLRVPPFDVAAAEHLLEEHMGSSINSD